ncbi:MAG: hypothetical protein ACXWWW_12120 [Candidatus Deferrimicrobiaceae bacterium]
MTARRIVTCLLASIALFLSPPVSSQALGNAAKSESIKGTVVKVADTAYFDGAKKVNQGALQPGNLVLVFCGMAGKDPKATLVRIIGGKKL